jgi:Mrp family chromosome partitioning ATPase
MELADVVIIDAGPLLSVNDPIALMPHVDSVVLVARAGRTTAEIASRTAELLKRAGAPVVGVSLTGVTSSASSQPYYAQVRSAPIDAAWRRRRAASKRAGSGV